MSKYLKSDSELGYITDREEIENEKFNRLRHVTQGFMLGDFDNLGKYQINNQILKELVAMPKYLTENLDNAELCNSALKLDKQLTFIVSYEGDVAKLSLLEKMNFAANNKFSASYSNIVETVLDEVAFTGTINKNNLYRRWNISIYPGQILDIFSLDEKMLEKYFGIVRRFKYLLKANMDLQEKEEELEEIESEQALIKLEIIKNYPELFKLVSKDLTVALANKNGLIALDKPGFSKTINQTISQSIEVNKSILNDKDLESFNSDNALGLKTTNLKREQLIQTISKEDKIVLNYSDDLTLSELASQYVKSCKAVEEKSKTRAVSILKGADVTITSQLVEKLKMDNGLKPETIVNPSLIQVKQEEQKIEVKKEAKEVKQEKSEKKQEKKQDKTSSATKKAPANTTKKGTTTTKTTKKDTADKDKTTERTFYDGYISQNVGETKDSFSSEESSSARSLLKETAKRTEENSVRNEEESEQHGESEQNVNDSRIFDERFNSIWSDEKSKKIKADMDIESRLDNENTEDELSHDDNRESTVANLENNIEESV